MDSVINQTLREIEIIVINDKSPDDSLQIINEYQKKDSRIILIDKRINEGVGKARNDGIEKATGEFVIFMDSDDFYPGDSVLEKLYAAAKEHNVKASGGRLQKLEIDGTLTVQDNPNIIDGLSFSQDGLMKYSDYQYDYGYTCYMFERRLLKDNGICFPTYSRFQDPLSLSKRCITQESFSILMNLSIAIDWFRAMRKLL